MRRKSTARGSAENVRTLLAKLGYPLGQRDLHINFPGGSPVDGPSAGAAMAVVAISAITGCRIDGQSAVTGEITVHGAVKAVGGVPAKVEAAKQAGIARVFIPKENDAETLHASGVEIVCVSAISELLDLMLLSAEQTAQKPSTAVLPEPLPAAALGESTVPAVTAGTSAS